MHEICERCPYKTIWTSEYLSKFWNRDRDDWKFIQDKLDRPDLWPHFSKHYSQDYCVHFDHDKNYCGSDSLQIDPWIKKYEESQLFD